MPPRRFVQFVHTQFPASKAAEVTGCVALRTPWYTANPGKEAEGSFSQQNCCQSRHMQNLPCLAPLPPKATNHPLPADHTQPCFCHTCASLQSSATGPEGKRDNCPRHTKALFERLRLHLSASFLWYQSSFKQQLLPHNSAIPYIHAFITLGHSFFGPDIHCH